jgi:hypothetical protein
VDLSQLTPLAVADDVAGTTIASVPYVPPVTAAASRASGDVSGDNKLTMYDAALVVRYLAGANIDVKNADINGDGKVDVADVLAIARKALGL